MTFNAIKIYLQFKTGQFALTLSGLCQLLMMIAGRLLIVSLSRVEIYVNEFSHRFIDYVCVCVCWLGLLTQSVSHANHPKQKNIIWFRAMQKYPYTKKKWSLARIYWNYPYKLCTHTPEGCHHHQLPSSSMWKCQQLGKRVSIACKFRLCVCQVKMLLDVTQLAKKKNMKFNTRNERN